MRGAWKRWRVALAAIAAAGAIALWIGWPYFSSAALLLDLAGDRGWARRVLPVRLARVAIEDVSVPTRHGDVGARLYTGDPHARRSVLVFPGVHKGGVDEPRLAAFTKRLAEAGATVVSVPLPDLREYRITPQSTDVIEDAILWLTGRRDLTPGGRVGVIGVSFSGGLALVAAGRAAVRDKITAVVSLGGHADLPRVMTYLCTGRLPDGSTRPPHDYGLAVLLRRALPGLAPPEQLGALDRTLVAFLDASSEASTDLERAKTLFASAQQASESLPEPSRGLMRAVNDRDVASLGARLLPLVETIGGDAALSPERSPATLVPVFAIHGRDDNVIPSSETPLVAAYLARHGNAHVRTLLTPLVSHANLETDASFADAWPLVRFWAAVWSALD